MPMTSLGSMSEVNWTRWNEQWNECASACARVVLPTPGTSSIEQVAARQQGDQGEANGFVLAANHAGNGLLQLGNLRGRVGGDRLRRHSCVKTSSG